MSNDESIQTVKQNFQAARKNKREREYLRAGISGRDDKTYMPRPIPAK